MVFLTECFGIIQMTIAELFEYTFIRHALIAGVLASVACGIIGAFVVTRRIVSIAGGIAHASFGGIGIAAFFGISPVLPALSFGALSGILLSLLGKKKGSLSEDTGVGILWATGMSIGVLFLSLSKGYTGDLFTYLFGNILTVTVRDLIGLAILDTGIILLIFAFFKELVSISFDEEFAEARGLPVLMLQIILFFAIALTVVVLMKIVGIILVIAMLTLPSATAKRFASSIKKLILYGIAVALVDIAIGLLLAFRFDLPAGASSVLVATVVFLLAQLVPRHLH